MNFWGASLCFSPLIHSATPEGWSERALLASFDKPSEDSWLSKGLQKRTLAFGQSIFLEP